MGAGKSFYRAVKSKGGIVMQISKGVIFGLLIAGLATIFCSTGESQVLWFAFEGSGDTASLGVTLRRIGQ